MKKDKEFVITTWLIVGVAMGMGIALSASLGMWGLVFVVPIACYIFLGLALIAFWPTDSSF